VALKRQNLQMVTLDTEDAHHLNKPGLYPTLRKTEKNLFFCKHRKFFGKCLGTQSGNFTHFFDPLMTQNEKSFQKNLWNLASRAVCVRAILQLFVPKTPIFDKICNIFTVIHGSSTW
jgi:hypothetical protein